MKAELNIARSLKSEARDLISDARALESIATKLDNEELQYELERVIRSLLHKSKNISQWVEELAEKS